MYRAKNNLEAGIITISILGVAFVISMRLQELLPSQQLVSMLFVLAVFLTSLMTQGYFWGIFGIHPQCFDRQFCLRLSLFRL